MPSLPILSAHSSTSVPAVITPQISPPWAVHSGVLLWLLCSLFVALVVAVPGLANHVLPPLPAYSMTLQVDGTCWLCGPEETTPQSLSADLPIDLLVRPLAPVWGPTFLHLYVQEQTRLRRVFTFAQRQADGSLHLRGLAREVLDLTGDERGPMEIFARVSRSPLPPPPWNASLAPPHGETKPRLSVRLHAR